MGRITVCSLAAALCFNSPMVSAAPMTCKQLVATCNNGIGATCMNPVSGVLQTEVAQGRVCIRSYTWAGLVGILNHWAEENPTMLGISGWDCMAKALAQAFPCQ